MLQIRSNPFSPAVRAARTALGLLMIGAAFVVWGRWVVAGLGLLILISAWIGYRPPGKDGGGGCGCCQGQ